MNGARVRLVTGFSCCGNPYGPGEEGTVTQHTKRRVWVAWDALPSVPLRMRWTEVEVMDGQEPTQA
jgi:hypothetical protein